MEANFWEDKWEKQIIGFNQSKANSFLVKFIDHLKEDTGDIFVPLCGKSIDMLYIKQETNKKIIGSELVDSAIFDFYQENNLSYKVESTKHHKIYNHQSYQLIQGDLFKIGSEQLKNVSWIYDRASIVALPLEIRKQYANFLIKTLPKAKIFLITFEYDDSQKLIGPPFSVTDQEIHQLFNTHYNIKLLEKYTSTPQMLKFIKNDIASINENIYLLEPKSA
ncbi:MAG: hypothetical protein COB02_14295 [Candidatus Cloacimonadota bacterium]|nr:MAG: hypothetical protein COB02_14295 [Candidatus Cloacimonadota bacterium]